jgi:hypothetical protein
MTWHESQSLQSCHVSQSINPNLFRLGSLVLIHVRIGCAYLGTDVYVVCDEVRWVGLAGPPTVPAGLLPK